MKSMRIDTGHAIDRRTNAELAQRVRLSLARKRKELSNVSVIAELGTIRLAGAVSSFYVKQVALSLAGHVAGVLQVIDELEVNQEAEPPAFASRMAARLPR